MKTTVKANFSNDFNGILEGKNATVAIGKESGQMKPYEMLLGALLGCLYATFLDIIEKMKIDFDHCEFSVEGENREETPTTLKHVKVSMTLAGVNPKQEGRVERAANLASKYCSIYQTLSKVSEMELELRFN